jgi:hypothetical protein
MALMLLPMCSASNVPDALFKNDTGAAHSNREANKKPNGERDHNSASDCHSPHS